MALGLGSSSTPVSLPTHGRKPLLVLVARVKQRSCVQPWQRLWATQWPCLRRQSRRRRKCRACGHASGRWSMRTLAFLLFCKPAKKPRRVRGLLTRKYAKILYIEPRGAIVDATANSEPHRTSMAGRPRTSPRCIVMPTWRASWRRASKLVAGRDLKASKAPGRDLFQAHFDVLTVFRALKP